ncbi:glycoside hydrolase family 73 protein [Flammeovirga sp. SJP92]|uniref:glycoside hydrolase family 73 protein n=1 Tax=Flammeovirga sp. SJP92 TaxID=1775430 RepID=UPI0015619180|nr:glucosaminidase domain-containing protein [Flammeovirga sp. SJP92]
MLLILALCSIVITSYSKNIKLNQQQYLLNEQPNKLYTYQEYVVSYGYLAVQTMKEFKIPASVILAQAMLETSFGNSTLSQKSNNHFGIKCGDDWQGQRVQHSDDEHQECFRAYPSVKDSFWDYGQFITSRPWYLHLFKINTNNYRSWAVGLHEAGYATDPQYSQKIIDLIERYQLYQLDEM